MHAENLDGARAFTARGERLGKVVKVFSDKDKPTFVAIKSSIFDATAHLAPLTGAVMNARELTLPITLALLHSAPLFSHQDRLSLKDEDAIYIHYGLPVNPVEPVPPVAPPVTEPPLVDPLVPPVLGTIPNDPTVPGMVRSEEELTVGKTTVPTGKARLTKKVVEEQVNLTIPVAHEELVVERMPVVDPIPTNEPLVEEQHNITLHAEVPIVEKKTVPKEEVRIGKKVVEEAAHISENIQKEEVVLEEGPPALDVPPVKPRHRQAP